MQQCKVETFAVETPSSSASSTTKKDFAKFSTAMHKLGEEQLKKEFEPAQSKVDTVAVETPDLLAANTLIQKRLNNPAQALYRPPSQRSQSAASKRS